MVFSIILLPPIIYFIICVYEYADACVYASFTLLPISEFVISFHMISNFIFPSSISQHNKISIMMPMNFLLTPYSFSLSQCFASFHHFIQHVAFELHHIFVERREKNIIHIFILETLKHFSLQLRVSVLILRACLRKKYIHFSRVIDKMVFIQKRRLTCP